MPEVKKNPPTKGATDDQKSTAAVNLAASDWALLKAVAFARAKQHGGRPSVSKLLSDLISANRQSFLKEAGKYLAMFKE